MNKLWDKLLFYLSVPRCVCCKERLSYGNAALCPTCLKEYEALKEDNCAVCLKPLSECSCATPRLKAHFMPRLIKVFRYRGTEDRLAANSLIYSLKRDNRADVLSILAKDLAISVRNSVKAPEELLITNVPRKRSSIVKYGIDHAALLAKALAKELNAEYLDVLYSKAKRIQKKLTTEARLENAIAEVKRNVDLKKRRVMLVDDIVTSGASMSAAASVLRSLGAKNITAACIAISFNDDAITPPNKRTK